MVHLEALLIRCSATDGDVGPYHLGFAFARYDRAIYLKARTCPLEEELEFQEGLLMRRGDCPG